MDKQRLQELAGVEQEQLNEAAGKFVVVFFDRHKAIKSDVYMVQAQNAKEAFLKGAQEHYKDDYTEEEVKEDMEDIIKSLGVQGNLAAADGEEISYLVIKVQ